MLLTVTAACTAPLITPDRWTSLEAVCAPVLVDLVPYADADVSVHYYIDLDDDDPSDFYLAHLVELARSASPRRSENMGKHSQLKTDQARQPLLKAVNISCGRLRWETADRARVSGSGGIAPLPNHAPTLRGHGAVFILERRNGAWVIVGKEGFWRT